MRRVKQECQTALLQGISSSSLCSSSAYPSSIIFEPQDTTDTKRMRRGHGGLFSLSSVSSCSLTKENTRRKCFDMFTAFVLPSRTKAQQRNVSTSKTLSKTPKREPKKQELPTSISIPNFIYIPTIDPPLK